MWFILGMIVLLIAFSIIWYIATEKIEDKIKLMNVGYFTGSTIMAIMFICFTLPKTQELENKVNELTTELYESYSLIDSLEQEKE